MAARFKPIKDSHGRTIDVEFLPSNKMFRYVMAMSLEKNASKTNEQVAKELGLRPAEIDSWWRDYTIVIENKDGTNTARNYFEEFFDESLQIRSGEEREMLRIVGMKRAMEGNYNYWRDMSRTYGTISAEQVEHKHMIIKFDELRSDATTAEIEDRRKKLLDAHRAVDREKSGGLVRLSPKKSGGKGA